MNVNRLRQRLSKKFEGNILSAGDLDALSFISYGISVSTAIDLAIGRPGFPSGRLTEIVGLESKGKSSLAYHILAECQKQGGIGVLLESESGFEAKRLEALGVKPNDLILCQPPDLESSFAMMEENILAIRDGEKFKGPVVMVLDSVAGLPSESEKEGNYDDQHMGLSARIVSQGLRKLMWSVAEHKIVLVFLNQLRKTMERYGNEYACVTGDTLIDCPRDISVYPYGIPIKDLVGQQFYTYAWSRNKKRFVVRKALRVWKTRRNAEVWALDYTWGKDPRLMQYDTLRATPDHRILLQDGTYCKLKDLQPGDKLVPLYRGSGGPHVGDRKRISLECRTDKYTDEHRFIYQELFGKLDRYTHVHHIDGNCLNNEINNLQAMHGSDHGKITAREKFENMSDETYERWCENIKLASKLNKDKRVQSLRKAWTPEMREAARLRALEYWTQERREEQVALVKSQMTYEKRLEVSKKLKQAWEEGKYDKRRPRNSNLLNHEVVGVRFLGYEDVYDMEVEGAHNFVANGVVVHNSYGGMAIGYRATLRMEVKNMLKDRVMVGKEAVGVKVHVRFLKNKIGIPFEEAEYLFNYRTGLDPIEDLWQSGLKLKLLKTAGGGFFKLSDGKTRLKREQWEDFITTKFKSVENAKKFMTQQAVAKGFLKLYE